MKYILSLVLLISMHQISLAQNVGIGTNTPNNSAQLDVSSTTKGLLVPRMTAAQRAAIPAPAAGLIVYETDQNIFYQYDGTTWRKMLNSIYWNNSTTRSYVYNTTDSIGIGTSVPAERLHINNGSLRMSRSSSFDNKVVFNMPASITASEYEGLQFTVANIDKAFIGYVSNAFVPSVLRLSGGASSRNDISISSTGNVGIGTGDPQALFHVAGNGLFDGTNPTIQLQNSGVDKGFIQLSTDNIRIGTNSSNTNGNFVIRTGGGDRVFVDNAGNVSIATQTDAPGYKLRLGGKMICEEVKVKLQGSWPDYVFDKNYYRPGFPELEKFILTNKHLPNIPNAAEVAKNGIELGDMQKRLTEKVEELTLYILDLHKRIAELEKK